MIADEPLEHLVLARPWATRPAEVEQALRDLAAEYTEQGRGFELRELAGGWRFYTREEYADVVSALRARGPAGQADPGGARDPRRRRLPPADQPGSRISAIRGVNVDGVVRTLVTRGLIDEVGNDGESGAILYGTTNYFLERMGLQRARRAARAGADACPTSRTSTASWSGRRSRPPTASRTPRPTPGRARSRRWHRAVLSGSPRTDDGPIRLQKVLAAAGVASRAAARS